MKKKDKKTYAAPQLEVSELCVEAGIAQSALRNNVIYTYSDDNQNDYISF